MRMWRVVEGGLAAENGSMDGSRVIAAKIGSNNSGLSVPDMRGRKSNGLSPWTLEELSAAERALLTGMRRWFQDGTARAMAAMRVGLSVAGVPNTALLPMFAMLGTFAVHGAGRPEILPPTMPAVSADEAALLDAIAAVQAGEAELSTQLLDRWLPAPALVVAADAMRELARILEIAGIRLRRRRQARLVGRALAAE